MSITERSTGFDPFSHDMWDLFNGFPFDQSILSSLSIPFDTSDFAMACIDWKETPQAHVLWIDLPGMKKEEVKVEVDGSVLQISGERTGENQDENTKWHLVERSSGKFMRRFRLPENAKTDRIKAAMENGVLTVTVPKEEVKKPEVKSRAIAIEGGQGGVQGVLSCLKMPSLFKSKKH